MRLIRGLRQIRPENRGGVATIGNFDGVHRGHVALLDQLQSCAKLTHGPLTVVLFEPQPREYFAQDQAPPRLTRLRDKLELLASHGVDQVLCLPFNRHLRELSASQFIQQVLVDGLGVKHLVVGDDFRFGCDRAGDFKLLSEEGEKSGFKVEHTHTYDVEGTRVSSSRIRTLLASGNFEAAAQLLGRPYSYQGRVVPDRQLGRTIGVPTANLPLPDLPLVLSGVYAGAVFRENGDYYPGAINLGWRPTVGSKRPVLEVHLIDFDGDLYGERLTVIPCIRLRGEVTFNGIDALKQQLALDVAISREYMVGEFVGDDRETFEVRGVTIPLATAPLSPPSHQRNGR